MKKILVSIILFSGLLTTAAAKPVGKADALKAAEYFWQQSLHGSGTLSPTPWAFDQAYLFTCPEGGFVILSADDCASPIIGYSTTGHIDPSQLPTQLAERMQAYCLRIAEGSERKAPATAEDTEAWQRLLQGLPLSADEEEDRVDPLIETHWHQDGYYSTLCPNGTVTGCAATAQSQFMRYWRFPAFGLGRESYSLPAYGTLSADFAHTLYDWQNMPEQVTTGSSTAEQQAVATLMYHVGVSLHTSYNSPDHGGSGAVGLAGFAGVPSIDNSLKNFFFYNPQMRVIMRTDPGWTNQAWDDTLAAELRLRHPIVYCGVAPEGGHGFVCDGFERRDNKLYFHFNFGWSGTGDGYYTTNDICPNVSPTGEVGSAYHFNQSNQALLGAVPSRGLHVGDTVVNLSRQEGETRVLFSSDYYEDGEWSVSCDQPWITVDTTGVGRAGWVTLRVEENRQGDERHAVVTFTQEEMNVSLKVKQTFYAEEDYCPMKVKMQSTGNGGWEGGAYLSFESTTGFVYATTSLAAGRESIETVRVAPSNLNVVFHSGGGTDRYINYFVYNQYDEEVVAVEYAYRNGGTHLVGNPCGHVGINTPSETVAHLWPNPTTGIVHIETAEKHVAEIFDMQGRHIGTTSADKFDLSQMPKGLYLINVTTPTKVCTRKIALQ